MAASMQQALGDQLLKAAAVVEEQIDQQMEKMETLDEDDLEAIRRRRLEELKRKQSQKQEWLNNGHGQYEELPDERAFFDTTKKSNKVVAHFFRTSTERCRIVDMHLAKIAPRHIEARFVKVNVDKFPFLTSRLNIRVLPTIAVVVDSNTVDYIRGFDDLGGTDEFKTETLEWRLSRSGVINYDGPSGLPGVASGGKLKKVGKGQKKIIRGRDDDDSDAEDDW